MVRCLPNVLTSNTVQVEKPNGKLKFIVINEKYTESALKPVRQSEEEWWGWTWFYDEMQIKEICLWPSDFGKGRVIAHSLH